jgi:peroxiredoxin
MKTLPLFIIGLFATSALSLAQFPARPGGAGVAIQAPAGPQRPKFDVGAMAPEINVKTVVLQDGKMVEGIPWKLSEKKGKAVLVYFWRKGAAVEIPMFDAVNGAYARYNAKGFEVIGINCDGRESEAELRGWLLAKDVRWPNYIEGAGQGNQINKLFGVPTVPYTFFIDRTGKIRYVNVIGDSIETMAKVLSTTE